jgi:hypothetical protein
LPFDDGREQIVVPEEPERPQRFAGPERRRQQVLIRRLIAVGVGVGFVILLVVGVRGCLEARSDRGLRNYAQDVATIMQESEQRGSEFFELLESGDTTELELQQQIRALRGASESLLSRAEKLSVPDQMRDAQSAVTLSLKLRRDALGLIADDVTQATADAERAEAIERITQQMGSLYASDVLWAQLAVPEITSVLESEDVEAQSLPAGNFMPANEATKYLDQTEIVTLLTGVSGTDTTAGLHGLGLVQVSLGDVVLSTDGSNTVPDDSREISVQVMNQGESEETDVLVSVTVNGEETEQTIPTLGNGATETVNLQLTTLPQPGTETTVDVFVQPVSGESVTENNEASYTVIFGTSSTG